MTERQKALLAYLHTIKPNLRGSRTVDELFGRIIACVKEDMTFVVVGFTEAAVEIGRRVAEQKINDVVKSVSLKAGELLSNVVSDVLKK